MSTPDDDLVPRAKAGDAEAAGLLLRRHLPGLRAFVRLRAGPRLRAKESSSDVVQSVCREVLRDLGELRGDDERTFKSWLYAAALHKIAKRREHWGAERRDVGREAGAKGGGYEELLDSYATLSTPSRAAAAREEVERIEAAFDRLPEDYREVLVEVRLRGLSHREVAERTGRSEQAVRHLLHRARARLAMLLG